MALDDKIKRVTLMVSIKHLLKGAKKSPERVARNIIEIGCNARKMETEKIEQKLYDELLELIKSAKEQTIINWVMEHFG